MADHQPIEVLTIIIITTERETVEERIPIQVIELVDRWLDHRLLTGVAINHLIKLVQTSLFALSCHYVWLQADYRRNNNSNTYKGYNIYFNDM